MSPGNLDRHLRDHYASEKIDPRVLDRLRRLAALEKAESGARASKFLPKPRQRRFARFLLAAAAVVALFLLPLSFLDSERVGMPGAEPLASSILREVALNHNKNLGVEFPADGYAELRQQMGELDFSLRAPRRVADRGLEMIGGRYCSIQGRLAAQIKLQYDGGRILTLYQTAIDEFFEGLPEFMREEDGVQIRVWREDGLLFALAGS